MDLINCVRYPLCVEWSTTLPSEPTTCKSPSILLLGDIEWNLELRCLREYYETKYELSMVRKDMETKRKSVVNVTSISVMSFIHSSSFNNQRCKSFYVQGLKSDLRNILWCKTTNELLPWENLGPKREVIIDCLFRFKDTQILKKDVSKKNALNIVDLQSLSRDFSAFLKDETFSDVKLKCAGRTFPANRSVLAARSEVFAAMFRNKMAEKVSGVVQIKGMDPKVLELLLEYMYSAEMKDLCEETVYRLYEAADKYAVHGLRQACSDFMVDGLKTDNCLDLLVLADKHSDEKFKEAVACFVAVHLVNLNVESWSTFRNKYPLLVLPIYEKRLQDSIPGAAKRAKH